MTVATTGRPRGLRRRMQLVSSLLAALSAALVLVPFGESAPSLVLTLSVVPGTLTPGESALAVVQLANSNPGPLRDVVVSMTLPSALTATSAPGCKLAAGSAVVTCSIGQVAAGATARAYVVARVAPHLAAGTHVSVRFVLHTGPGAAPISSRATAGVAALGTAGEATCLKVPHTLSATLDDQTTELPSPPVANPRLHLPCTPLSVGVLPQPSGFHTNVSTVELPSLSHVARVVLSFPDEKLPDEQLIGNLPAGRVASLDNPDPLWVLSPVTGARRVVPACPGGALPLGWQSCVANVRQNDPDGDSDAGTITLLVRGEGFGDPRYVG
jgi:hypothetical protein